jgi:hypothetical protein
MIGLGAYSIARSLTAPTKKRRLLQPALSVL